MHVFDAHKTVGDDPYLTRIVLHLDGVAAISLRTFVVLQCRSIGEVIGTSSMCPTLLHADVSEHESHIA